MKLSAPIYHLKRQARLLSRAEGLPLHKALDRVAAREGFARWSLLAAQLASASPAKTLLAQFHPGELVLLGARPNHGKTQLSLEFTVAAMQAGRRGVFFTLEYSTTDVLALFASIGENPAAFRQTFELDTSDSIQADYIMERLATVPFGTVVVVDYLQLLDRKRTTPELTLQIQALQAFVRDRGLIMVFLSQINRRFDASAGVCPGLKDVQLANPLDLGLFNKACFLHDGKLEITATS